MSFSPHEKLRALEDVLRKKEAEKKDAEKKARQTEEEVKKLRAALRAEQEEVLIEEELANTKEQPKREEPQEPQEENKPFSIDELVQDAPKNQQLGGALYALQERMRGGMNLYEMTQTAQALTSLRQENALTQNQYNILNEFEEQLQQRGVQTGYSDQAQLYARQATETIENIKQSMGVKIGNTYHDTSDLIQ